MAVESEKVGKLAHGRLQSTLPVHAKTRKRAAEEAARKAATGQAGKDQHARVEAKRWAASGQADKDKHAGVEAERWHGEDEDEEEGEVHQDDSGGSEETGAVDYAEVKVDVDRDDDAGDY